MVSQRERNSKYMHTCKCVYMFWESILGSVYHRLWSTRRCTRRMLKANLLSTIPFLSLLKDNNYPALALSVCCRAWRAVLRTYSVFVHAGSKINTSRAPNATKNWLASWLKNLRNATLSGFNPTVRMNRVDLMVRSSHVGKITLTSQANMNVTTMS